MKRKIKKLKKIYSKYISECTNDMIKSETTEGFPEIIVLLAQYYRDLLYIQKEHMSKDTNEPTYLFNLAFAITNAWTKLNSTDILEEYYDIIGGVPVLKPGLHQEEIDAMRSKNLNEKINAFIALVSDFIRSGL